jgi:hypothetical protein
MELDEATTGYRGAISQDNIVAQYFGAIFQTDAA